MLGQRRKRKATSKLILVQCIVFAEEPWIKTEQKQISYQRIQASDKWAQVMLL